ncbi:MAG: NosD domain-containing protein [Acidimicrobiales bacterium]
MKLQRALGLASGGALLLLGTVAVSPASAATETVTCGEHITHSLTVANDIGPCVGTDGLDVVANGITLDLGGHTVTGGTRTNTSTHEYVGINLMGVNGVTVRSGTVTGFDAGVADNGGSNNTITSLNVHDNVNHSTQTGAQNVCNYGDGILLDNATGDRVTGNQSTANGPFSGIALIEASKNNTVSNNYVANNNVANILPNGDDGPCGPFQENGNVGRPFQDIGIRVEGPGADNNTVSGNVVNNNMLNGISIHGYVCHPPGGFFPPQPNNTGNTVTRNSVSGNGFNPEGNQDGIAILVQGPPNVVCPAFGNTITYNVSTANARYGVYGGGRDTHDNNISYNVVRNNLQDGVHLDGPSGAPSCGPGTMVSPCPGAINNTLIGNIGSGNAQFDGFDGNPACDNNLWQANRFGTVNQACVAAGGGTGTVTGT